MLSPLLLLGLPAAFRLVIFLIRLWRLRLRLRIALLVVAAALLALASVLLVVARRCGRWGRLRRWRRWSNRNGGGDSRWHRRGRWRKGWRGRRRSRWCGARRGCDWVDGDLEGQQCVLAAMLPRTCAIAFNAGVPELVAAAVRLTARPPIRLPSG